MKTYTSTQPFYDGSLYFKPGEPFSTDLSAKDEWTEVKPTEAAAIEASLNPIPDDADLEALPLTALKAVAYLRHVPRIGEMDADGLKTAIRASYEPKL
jgi:hypothetical protein